MFWAVAMKIFLGPWDFLYYNSFPLTIFFTFTSNETTIYIIYIFCHCNTYGEMRYEWMHNIFQV